MSPLRFISCLHKHPECAKLSFYANESGRIPGYSDENGKFLLTLIMNKKDLKTLHNVLGKQGSKLDDLSIANTPSQTGIDHIDALFCSQIESATLENDGWQVGYAVDYIGTGITRYRDNYQNLKDINEQEDNESSGFSSDSSENGENSTSDEHFQQVGNTADSFQCLDEIKSMVEIGSKFYVRKDFIPNEVHLRVSNIAKRYESETSSQDSITILNNSPKSRNIVKPCLKDFLPHNVNQAQSGLWCHTLLLQDNKTPNRSAIVDNILLDRDKLDAIAAAMSQFTLRPPPGWENIDDCQLLNFLKEKNNQ